MEGEKHLLVQCEQWFNCRLKGCHHRKPHEPMMIVCESECRRLVNEGVGQIMHACVPVDKRTAAGMKIMEGIGREAGKEAAAIVRKALRESA